MVVIENIEAKKDSVWPTDTCQQIEEAVGKLHNAGLVFGDLWPPNILFSEGKVFFVDFDWAGVRASLALSSWSASDSLQTISSDDPTRQGQTSRYHIVEGVTPYHMIFHSVTSLFDLIFSLFQKVT